MSYIYLIQNLETSKYKIGISKNPKRRIKQLQTSCGEDLELIYEFKSEFPRKIETALHNRYGHLRARGEWFNISYNQEKIFINECEKIEKNLLYLKKEGNYFV